jgi:hypothetical protein
MKLKNFLVRNLIVKKWNLIVKKLWPNQTKIYVHGVMDIKVVFKNGGSAMEIISKKTMTQPN